MEKIKYIVLTYKEDKLSFNDKYMLLYKITMSLKWFLLPIMTLTICYFQSMILLMVLMISVIVYYKLVSLRQYLAILANQEIINQTEKNLILK